MDIKFHSKLQGADLFLVARGDDRPNIIVEVTSFLEAHDLYVHSIGFNLTSPGHDQFSMELVARGFLRQLEKAHLALDAQWPVASAGQNPCPKLSWVRASMFHVGLNTPDRAGLVAAVSKAVGASGGTFVHLLGGIDNSGDSAQGGTPYFNLRASVATASAAATAQIIERLHQEGFGRDLWTVPLDPPA